MNFLFNYCFSFPSFSLLSESVPTHARVKLCEAKWNRTYANVAHTAPKQRPDKRERTDKYSQLFGSICFTVLVCFCFSFLANLLAPSIPVWKTYQTNSAGRAKRGREKSKPSYRAARHEATTGRRYGLRLRPTLHEMSRKSENPPSHRSTLHLSRGSPIPTQQCPCPSAR